MITIQTELSEREISELEVILKNAFKKDRWRKELSWTRYKHERKVEGLIVNEQGKYLKINAIWEGKTYNVTLEIDISNKNYPTLLEACRKQLSEFYDTLIKHTAN